MRLLVCQRLPDLLLRLEQPGRQFRRHFIQIFHPLRSASDLVGEGVHSQDTTIAAQDHPPMGLYFPGLALHRTGFLHERDMVQDLPTHQLTDQEQDQCNQYGTQSEQSVLRGFTHGAFLGL